jgi:hypothetical protein
LYMVLILNKKAIVFRVGFGFLNKSVLNFRTAL